MPTESQPDDHPLLYLDDEGGAERFLRSIEASRELAIDTEGASFHRFIDRIYLLQISTREKSAILDPLSIGTPAALGAMLDDPAVEVVFHDADYDLRLLHQDYGWHVRNIFDTRVAAQLLGIKAFGLGALLERYFGLKLDKKHQRADWSMRPLSADMLAYAAQDTRHLLDLRDRMRAELEAKGRLEWAREEFVLLEGTRWDADGDADADAFLRLKGARDLDRRGLAVLRELVAWRDTVAGQLDRSTFRVVGNEVMLIIARDRPRTRDDLGAIRGMPRGILENRGHDILAAVQRGLSVPDADLPKFARSPRRDRDPDFDARVLRLKSVRDAFAQRLDLDPGVLCGRERLETIARLNPPTHAALEAVPALRRWQVELMGDELLAAVSGGADRSPYRE